MANGILSLIGQGFNIDPAGAAAEGRSQAQQEMGANLTLLNTIEARARQAQMPKMFQRTLMGDPEAMGFMAVHAPGTLEALSNMQANQLRQQAALMKVAQGPELTAAQKNFKFALDLPPDQREMFLKTGGGQQINVNVPGQPSAQEIAMQEARAAGLKKQQERAATSSENFRAELNTEARQSGQTLNELAQFEAALFRGGKTGPLTEATIGFRRFLSQIGALSPEENQRLSDEQLLAALGNKMQLAMSKYMKGAISEREQDIMRATVPNLSNTVEGNLLLIEVMRELHRRQKIVARKVNEDFRRANARGEIFDAFESADLHAEKLSRNNPLFNKQMMRKQYVRSRNKDALLDTWSLSIQFIDKLKADDVVPAFPSLNDEAFLRWERNPKNKNQFVIVGDKLTVNE